jgi:aryl-alcohol dehydrogenase-like predicted oxidoreductase
MANGRVLRARPLQDAALRLGCAPDALALAVVAAQPFRPMVLSGAVTRAQVESNCDAMALAEALEGTGEFEVLMEQLRVDPEDYWQERSELAWN